MASSQPVPFLDLVTPHRELEEELVAAFRTAVRSAQFIGGAELESFEREFAEYLREQVLRRRGERDRCSAFRVDGRRRGTRRRGRDGGAHVHRDGRRHQPGRCGHGIRRRRRADLQHESRGARGVPRGLLEGSSDGSAAGPSYGPADQGCRPGPSVRTGGRREHDPRNR